MMNLAMAVCYAGASGVTRLEIVPAGAGREIGEPLKGNLNKSKTTAHGETANTPHKRATPDARETHLPTQSRGIYLVRPIVNMVITVDYQS